MPHVGGGGHSGGFSSSSSHGSSSSTPRYDNSGRLHSNYYVRPGFYIHSRYVPYTAAERRSLSNYGGYIIYFLLTLILLISVGVLIGAKGKYEESTLESYALNQYSEIYDEKDSEYENKLLVTFVAYEDQSKYDYVSIVGDNVDYATDSFFGNAESEFGKALLDNIPAKDYYEDLYSYLANSLNEINWEFTSNPYYGNVQASGTPNDINIVNKTDFGEINGQNELETACKEFYSVRGYNISFLIVDNFEAYKIEWGPVIFLSVVSAGLIALGLVGIVKTRKDIKEIEKEIKNGNAEKYYEGEDPFEEYYKDHPID